MDADGNAIKRIVMLSTISHFNFNPIFLGYKTFYTHCPPDGDGRWQMTSF